MRKKCLDKKVVFTVFLSLLLFCQALLVVLAAEPAQGVAILKVDRLDILQLPSRFRTSNDCFKKVAEDSLVPSRDGMDQLNISGSSEFSQLEFAKMLTQLPINRLIVVDLRLESHGYLDGMGVSWYSAYKRANWGKNTGEVEGIEKKLLNSTLTGPVEVARLGSDKSILSTIEQNVDRVLTERELVTSFGAKYFRFPVGDYTPPTNENVDQFLEFYKTLPKNAWLHLHCEAGEGRTTTFMTMIDMIRNAKKVSYDDIMLRQVLIGGQDLRSATSKDPWKREAYVARAEFTKHFYDYVTENPDLSISWTEWAKNHRK
jgi:hypothetical protein